MKYLVIKPRENEKLGEFNKDFVEFEVSKISDVMPFIEQHVGKEPVQRVVGDYVFWISNPYILRTSESGNEEILDNIKLIPNLMVNESEIAYGSVVATANSRVGNSITEGLTDVDIGYIMNAFTKSGAILVETENLSKPVAVDRVADNILSPSGVVTTQDTTQVELNIIEVDDTIPENLTSEIPTDDIYIV